MKIKDYIEANKNVRKLEIIAIIVLLIVSCFSYVYGFIKLNGKPNLRRGNNAKVSTIELV